MRKRSSKHYIEILPAALLPKRRAWQPLADSLPEGAWLLVLPTHNNEINQVILGLAEALKEKGKRVILFR